MGEESTTPVYICKNDNGKVVFEPLGEFEVVDRDITDVYSDDCDYNRAKPLPYSRSIMSESITVKAFLQNRSLRNFYKAIGMPAYLRTEYLFPKKKKRGTARRKRKIKRAEQRFVAFVRTVSREEYLKRASFSAPWPGPFEGENE